MTIKQACALKGWSICHAGRMAGLNPRTLYRIVNGSFFPNPDTAVKLHNVFNCPLEYYSVKKGRKTVIRCYDTFIDNNEITT